MLCMAFVRIARAAYQLGQKSMPIRSRRERGTPIRRPCPNFSGPVLKSGKDKSCKPGCRLSANYFPPRTGRGLSDPR